MKGVVFFLCVVVVLLSGMVTYQLQNGRQAHNAICALEQDVQVRHDQSVAFLKEHPSGIVSPVTHAIIITHEQLQSGIDNQESLLGALSDSGLNCNRSINGS